MRTRSPRVLAVAMIAALTVVACSSTSTSTSSSGATSSTLPPTSSTVPVGEVAGELSSGFVGSITALDAFVAVVADGDRLVVYVCNDGRTAEWFQAAQALTAETVETRNPSGALVSVSRIGTQVSGVLTLPSGERYDFSAPAAGRAPVLFRGVSTIGSTHVLGGWIVDGNAQRGSLVVTDGSSPPTVAPAAPIQPAGPGGTVAGGAPAPVAVPLGPPYDTTVEARPITPATLADVLGPLPPGTTTTTGR